MDRSDHRLASEEMDHSERARHGAAVATAQQGAGGEPDDLRDPHAYSESEDFGPLGQIRLADQHTFGAVLIHRLEAVKKNENSCVALDAHEWHGRTYIRANLKLEGEFDSGEVHEQRTGLLWSRAIAPF
jgi:copper resistance protein B